MNIKKVIRLNTAGWTEKPIYMVTVYDALVNGSVTVYEREDKVTISGLDDDVANVTPETLKLFNDLKKLSHEERISMLKRYLMSQNAINKFNL